MQQDVRNTSLKQERDPMIRKTILEKVRARAGMGGYAITGWRDTPLTTSGIYDDLTRSKYDPETFKTFNADTVLLIGRGRARSFGLCRPACCARS